MTAALRTPEWADTRTKVLARDGQRCSLARLFGGACHGIIDVHHLQPVNEGGDPYALDNCLSVCHRHHPMLEAMRRYVMRKRAVPPCRHAHRYDHARRECAERRARMAA